MKGNKKKASYFMCHINTCDIRVEDILDTHLHKTVVAIKVFIAVAGRP